MSSSRSGMPYEPSRGISGLSVALQRLDERGPGAGPPPGRVQGQDLALPFTLDIGQHSRQLPAVVHGHERRVVGWAFEATQACHPQRVLIAENPLDERDVGILARADSHAASARSRMAGASTDCGSVP